MRNFIALTLFFSIFISCSSLEEEPAGICVTCISSGPPEVTVVACSNGDGTITLTENGIEGVTSENDTQTFRIAQEASGASCN